MTNDLISMLAAGILAGCVVFAFNHMWGRVRGRKLPKWMLPAAAGAAMIGYSIYAEYSWYGRVMAGLPDSVEVVRTVEESAPWRPWTYLVPMKSRFLAIDRAGIDRVAGNPDLASATIMAVQRWAPVRSVPVVYDCAAGTRADLVGGVALDEAGNLTGGQWVPVGLEDEGLMATCNGG
jgi:hypothetical protein